MEIERISVLVAGSDLETSTSFWSALLDVEPTLTDGHEWAQLDVAAGRVNIGAGPQRPDATTVMLKVDNLGEFRNVVERLVGSAPPVELGDHERLVRVVGPGGESVVAYEPL